MDDELIDEYKNLSALDQKEINNEVKEDLVDHLYKGALPGAVVATMSSTSVFGFYHSVSNLFVLNAWISAFYFNLLLILSANFAYKKYKPKLTLTQWEIILSSLISVSALLWGCCIFFKPIDMPHKVGLLLIYCMNAGSFSSITVGSFKLCIATVNLVLLPLGIWFISQSDVVYFYGFLFVIMYDLFLISGNRRSTKWLKESLGLKIENNLVSRQANYDILTNLLNHRGLTAKITQFVKASKESLGGFSLICISINQLESINNSYGYQAGDIIIRSFAKRLETMLTALKQNSSIVRTLTRPRYDAFVVLINTENIDLITSQIKQIQSCISTPFYLEKSQPRISVSVGVSRFPSDSSDEALLLSSAYAAMVEAKNKGGDQIEYFQPKMINSSPLLIELETDLSKAMENNEFELFYQPIVDLESSRVASMEALIRWNSPTRGFVSPGDFIPIAEETGLILPINNWVIEEAVRQMSKWHSQGFSHLKVAVNLASKQLKQKDDSLIKLLDRVLTQYKLPASALELELVETSMLDESLAPIVNEISNKGIALSMDDFGTGYSSFSYLTRFKISKLKIDQSFTRGINNNPESAAIISSIIAMAKELKMKTLAEGVETKEQLAFLKLKGCQYIQGYYFSKPLNVKSMTDFLKRKIDTST